MSLQCEDDRELRQARQNHDELERALHQAPSITLHCRTAVPCRARHQSDHRTRRSSASARSGKLPWCRCSACRNVPGADATGAGRRFSRSLTTHHLATAILASALRTNPPLVLGSGIEGSAEPICSKQKSDWTTAVQQIDRHVECSFMWCFDSMFSEASGPGYDHH